MLLMFCLAFVEAAHAQVQVRLKSEPAGTIPDQFVVEFTYKPQARPRLFVNDVLVYRHPVSSPEEDMEPELRRGFPIQHFVVPGKNTLRVEVDGHAESVQGKLQKLTVKVGKDRALAETYSDVGNIQVKAPLTFKAPTKLKPPLWRTGQKIVWSDAEKNQVHAKIVELQQLLQAKKFEDFTALLAGPIQETVRLTGIANAKKLTQREMMEWEDLSQASDWAVRSPSVEALDCTLYGGGWLVECLEKGTDHTLQFTANEVREGRRFMWMKRDAGYSLYTKVSLF
ncbi:hypothetical protein [Myxococcus llanfairpwllgwyngyllgogerychwyrndrobwllllantysiliogogogochensis]|uniref:hypothetical protein n=1 Tax=Myxococcus llanfairpwllgwyngyllgogerychwyrndrobwllllantysiliogogogochensis TaxID=2590453 RepID=UPI00114768B6|nr:hypothetical protein [Myxococcus llanfairpwllgwyngyllgogerychwyrndrobwllllantysiliogogogochensis]